VIVLGALCWTTNAEAIGSQSLALRDLPALEVANVAQTSAALERATRPPKRLSALAGNDATAWDDARSMPQIAWRKRPTLKR
jgi:hypothetical protein